MAAGHSGQFTPMRLPVNTVIHTTLVGLEPQPSDRWSDALRAITYMVIHKFLVQITSTWYLDYLVGFTLNNITLLLLILVFHIETRK